MNVAYQTVYLFLINQILEVFSQPCPVLYGPCSCVPSMYAPVSIKCTGADSWPVVVNSLVNAKATKIDSLRITLTPVATLRNYSLDGFNVEDLTIDTCQLVRVDGLAFDNTLLTTLTGLNLNGNKLTQIPSSGVDRLVRLSSLQLGKNDIRQLTSSGASPFSTFRSRNILSKLTLNDNAIDSIPSSFFAGLTKIRDLDLSNNRLDQNALVALKSALADSANVLTNLNLKDNKISSIRPGDLNYPNLETLTLSNNGIQQYSFRAEMFSNTPKLTHLYLAGNPLMAWNSDLLRFLPNLVTLDASGTSIGSVPSNAFQYCPKLAELILSNAGIGEISSGAFSLIPSIIKISLDNNRLSR